MRDDIHSVFTGGRGSRYPFARFTREYIRDDDGTPVSKGRRYRRLERGWQEHWCFRYGVVDRFLRSRLGHHIDAVIAEVHAAVGDASSRDDILKHVERQTRLGRYRRFELCYGDGIAVPGFFHVDGDGILRERPCEGYRDYSVRRANEHLIDPDAVLLGEGHGFRRIEGVWYELRWLDLDVGAIASDRRHYGSCRRALTFKRQLGKGEIDSFGLRDWPDLVAAFRASIRNRRYDRGLKTRMEKAVAAAARTLAR